MDLLLKCLLTVCRPSEIRLMIYEILFDNKGFKTLEIRNAEPNFYNKNRHSRHRTTYRVIGRDLRRQSQPTTYRLLGEAEFHVSIMCVNQKIHEEATHLLYNSHSFSFGRDIEAIVPFFSDLTKPTRPLIHEICLIKQGFVYSRDYDRCEWSNACEFLRDNMRLDNIKLVVEGGRPSLGWAGLPQYFSADFRTLASVRYEALEWVWELIAIKGVRKLEISSEIHHCPPSHSSGMAFFAAFSASIECGFADFLQHEMVVS